MAIFFIAGVSAHGTSSGIDTTGADFIAIVVSRYVGDSGATAPTDSKGNTWTACTDAAGASTGCRIWYANNPTVGSGHTFTSPGSYGVVTAIAFSGVKSSGALDQEASNSAASGTSISSGSVTPSENGEVVISGIAGGVSGSMAIDGGFSIAGQLGFAVGNNQSGGGAYLVQTTAAAANPSWSWSGSAYNATAVASFRSAAAPSFDPRKASTVMAAA